MSDATVLRASRSTSKVLPQHGYLHAALEVERTVRLDGVNLLKPSAVDGLLHALRHPARHRALRSAAFHRFAPTDVPTA